MDEVKPDAGSPSSPPGKPSDKAGSSSEQTPIFSRNLELNALSVQRPRTGLRPDKPVPPMKPADRNLYFKIEAGKVLEILNRRISGMNRERVSIDLVKEIYQSWGTLWWGDDKFPVGPFSEMLDIVFSILTSVSRLSRKLDEKESSLVISLVQAMDDLAEGKAAVGYLDSCRMLVEKSRELGVRLELESGVNNKAAGLGSPVESPGSITEQPGGQAQKPDISSAVDEWFDQVANLIEESGTEESEARSEPLSADLSAGDAHTAKQVEDCSDIARQEAGAGESDSSAGELSPDERFRNAEAFEDTQAAPAAGEIPGEPVYQADKTVAPTAEPARQIQVQSPPTAAEQAAYNYADDNESPVMLDIISAYFKECCDRSVAIINHYLERLGGSSPRRTSHPLSECLEELLQLSENLEMEALVEDLSAVRETLTELTRAPEAEFDREKARVREDLCRLVAKLEKPVFSAP